MNPAMRPKAVRIADYKRRAATARTKADHARNAQMSDLGEKYVKLAEEWERLAAAIEQAKAF